MIARCMRQNFAMRWILGSSYLGQKLARKDRFYEESFCFQTFPIIRITLNRAPFMPRLQSSIGDLRKGDFFAIFARVKPLETVVTHLEKEKPQ